MKNLALVICIASVVACRDVHHFALDAGPAPCAEHCVAGARHCNVQGQLLICGGADAQGCHAWTAYDCPVNAWCSADACRCSDACQLDQSICDGALVRRCTGPSADGCFVWGGAEACADGAPCVDGACPAESPCRDGERSCVDELAYQACVDPEHDGSWTWSEPVACGEHQRCIAGACVCTATCTPDEAMCSDETSLMACRGPDADGCPYWGDAADCALANACLTHAADPALCPADWVCDAALQRCREATPDCAGSNGCEFEGQMLCQNETQYRQCKLGYDGCLVYDCSS